jgi:hypothetical protein
LAVFGQTESKDLRLLFAAYAINFRGATAAASPQNSGKAQTSLRHSVSIHSILLCWFLRSANAQARFTVEF